MAEQTDPELASWIRQIAFAIALVAFVVGFLTWLWEVSTEYPNQTVFTTTIVDEIRNEMERQRSETRDLYERIDIELHDLYERIGRLELMLVRNEPDLAALSETNTKVQRALSNIPEDTSAALSKIVQAEARLQRALSNIPEDTSAALSKIVQAEARLRQLEGVMIEPITSLQKELKTISSVQDDVANLKARVDEVSSVVSVTSENVERISALILNNPEKVLSLLVLQTGIDKIKDRLSGLITQMNIQETSLSRRISTVQWMIGTVFITLFGVMASVILPQLRRRHHPLPGSGN